jgi:hypothetical protein
MASKKKGAARRQAWNKGLEVDKRDGFTPAQVKRIRNFLADRGVPGLRDLALFSTAVDTMLHGQDLLPLVVGDVQGRNGPIRPVIEVARARGMPPVRCALSKVSAKALKKIDRLVRQKADRLFIPWRCLRQPSAERAAIEPAVEVVGGRGRTRSKGLWCGIFTSDEGSPYFERHWGFADSSRAFGPCENREHSEVSWSKNKGRPDRGLSSLRYLTVSA